MWTTADERVLAEFGIALNAPRRLPRRQIECDPDREIVRRRKLRSLMVTAWMIIVCAALAVEFLWWGTQFY